MIVSNSKKKLLICSITIPTTIATVIGITVGGYFVSYKANPFVNYAKAPINSTNEAFQAVYYSYLNSGSNLMVLPGFSLKPSLESALQDSKYNDAAFLLIDDYYSGESTSQVAGASFRADEGSFVTGIAIASYLNENKEYFKANDGKLTWGAYGGMPYNSVTSFMTGIQVGIAWFNTFIAAKNNKYEAIYQISIGNNQGDVYAGGFGPNDGDAIIDKFLQTNIDCLVPVAGPQVASAANKIVAKQKRTILIGVDSAAENDKVLKTKKLPIASNMPKIKEVIPFSSLKNVGLMTYDILNNIQLGRSYDEASNNIGGLGYQSLGTVDNGCVGVSEPGKEYFLNVMNDYSISNPISSKIYNNYNEATKSLKTIEAYNKLNSSEEYRKFIPFGMSKQPELVDIDKFNNSPLPLWGAYSPLPENGEPYQRMPEYVPISQNKNFTQQDWDYKKSSPERFKEILNPKTNTNFHNEIKEVLSTPTSVLLDASFSQSCYDGIAAFYNKNGVQIPYTSSTQNLIDVITANSKTLRNNSVKELE